MNGGNGFNITDVLSTKLESGIPTELEAVGKRDLTCSMPPKRASDGFDVFFVVSLTKLLNEKSSCLWFETP